MSEAHGYPALPKLAGWSFLPLSWLARLPSAMLPIGSLTLVYTATDSATLAGIASGAVGAGTAVGAPLLGMAVDRWGQRRHARHDRGRSMRRHVGFAVLFRVTLG